MTMLITVVAVAAVLLLARSLHRRLTADGIHLLVEKRRAGSLVASRGCVVDGSRRVDVAMALTGPTLFYESDEINASVDLEWVNEVEYDTCIGSGASVDAGKVLRLRCHNRNFEFIIPDDALLRWQTMLPERRAGLASGV